MGNQGNPSKAMQDSGRNFTLSNPIATSFWISSSETTKPCIPQTINKKHLKIRLTELWVQLLSNMET